MRRSGVSPLVCRSKLSREMARLAASGHRPSTQVGKLPAAARIASRVISGWPDAPDSPVHSGVAVGGVAPVVGLGANSERRSGSCAAAGVSRPSSTATAQADLSGMEPICISSVS